MYEYISKDTFNIVRNNISLLEAQVAEFAPKTAMEQDVKEIVAVATAIVKEYTDKLSECQNELAVQVEANSALTQRLRLEQDNNRKGYFVKPLVFTAEDTQ